MQMEYDGESLRFCMFSLIFQHFRPCSLKLDLCRKKRKDFFTENFMLIILVYSFFDIRRMQRKIFVKNQKEKSRKNIY